jgi:hypothetical protein
MSYTTILRKPFQQYGLDDDSRDRYMGQQLNTNENLNNSEDFSKYFKCRSCGKEFDSFGDMQKHIMTEHMQKGDIP